MAGKIPATSLWMIRGKYYDLSSFIPKHPGGELVLEQSRGGDITALVESHHFTDAPYKVIAPMEVDVSQIEGKIIDAGYTFDKGGFFQTIKGRVIEHLGTEVRGKPSFYYKARVVATIAAYLVSWAYCCFFPVWWPAILTVLSMRVTLIGIGHEAIHGRLQPQLWHLFDLVFNFPSESWHDEHCTKHHPHTKRFDYDPDETLDPFCRLNSATPWSPHHYLNVILQILVSFLASIGTYIEQHLVARKSVVMSTASVFFFQLLPIFIHERGWFVFFWTVCMSNALTLHSFHLSHINENHSGYVFKNGVDWGAHQLNTTSNWEASPISVTGMLELQIEHHLFPSLPYETQQQIVPLVKRTAAEFGVPYYEFKSLGHGILAHCGFMATLSMPPDKTKAQ